MAGGLVIGAMLTPLLLGVYMLRRELTTARRHLARVERWADDIDDWLQDRFGGPTLLEETAPMVAVDVAGGLRTRPTPYARQKGRHSA